MIKITSYLGVTPAGPEWLIRRNEKISSGLGWLLDCRAGVLNNNYIDRWLEVAVSPGNLMAGSHSPLKTSVIHIS